MKRDQLIVALDVEDLKQVQKIVQKLNPQVSFYKVGLRLFTREGPAVIRWLKKKRLKIFLDLKFHDIPNTVAQAVESATTLGVDLLSLHASGGFEMMRAAVESARLSARRLKKKAPQIFAVTVLTSLDEVDSLGVSGSVQDQVLRLAALAKDARVDGVICSPQEIRSVRQQIGSSLKILSPGIRLSENPQDDQRRTANPAQAIQDGADYLVIGRPILLAPDPRQKVREILSV